MGGCASTPKDLDATDKAAPAPEDVPAVAEAPAVADKAEDAEVSAPQEQNEDGLETKKEEPLVDLSEPAPVTAEEAKEEDVKEAAVEAEPQVKPAEEEEKKEVA